MSAAASGDQIVVQKSEVKRFIVDCMVKTGCGAQHAEQLADVLVAGDYRGHYSHGLNRLDIYIRDIQKHVCETSGQPEILSEKPATAWVDGKNLLGPVVGNFCMDLAIRKAKEVGVGWVAAKGSNHFGIAGWYTLRAAEHGLIGMSFTNTSPLMLATRSKQCVLGTNPLSVAAPGQSGDQFVLDMATTTVALGKIEMADRKGVDIPTGWAADSSGKETTSTKEALEGGGLLPLGGSEISGGYKGYGLAMMVELFCGILAGADWGPHVRPWKESDRKANLGQCFVAIDPKAFAPGCETRVQEMLDTFRHLEPAEPGKSVLVAGDPEKEHMTLCDTLGGIPYHPNQISHAKDTAVQLGVEPLTVKKC